METDVDSRSQGGENSGTGVKDEQIAKWLSEGWRFRIKTVRQRDYITRRKGGMERSLGAYDDDLWKRIKSLDKVGGEKSLGFETGVLEEIETLKEEVHKLSIRLDGLSCLLPQTVHGKKWWLFTRIGTLTRRVDALGKRYRELEKELGNSVNSLESLEKVPIKGLYERFKCGNCGAQHLVAVRFECTKCGAESWWGYWPSKNRGG